MEDRTRFSGSLLAFGLFLALLATSIRLAVLRQLIFFPVIGIYLYLITKTTTADPVTDLILGNFIAIHILFATDFILVTDVQNGLRRVGQTEPISKAPFMTRLFLASNLYTNPRGIGWTHRLSFISPSKSPRLSFLFTRITSAIKCFVIIAVSGVVTACNPAMVDIRSTSMTNYGLFWRILGTSSYAGSACASINLLGIICSIMAVSSGLSDPEDWPELFGSISDGYLVQRFWSRVWHNLLRRPLSVIADSILNFFTKRRTTITKFIWVWLVFFLSGVLHLLGESMLIGHLGTGSLYFFSIQPLAILLENSIMAAFGVLPSQKPNLLARALGMIWVMAWFIWCSPFILDPAISTGVFVDENTQRMVNSTIEILQQKVSI